MMILSPQSAGKALALSQNRNVPNRALELELYVHDPQLS
jgi:hypothetical protein